MKESETSPPPKPGHADTLKPSADRIQKEERGEDSLRVTGLSQEEMFEAAGSSSVDVSSGAQTKPTESPAGETHKSSEGHGSSTSSRETSFSLRSEILESGNNEGSWQPKPPKILMEDSSATPLELRSQIQLYATNE